MPKAKLKIRPPSERMIDFSTEHPDDRFRILASHTTEDGVLVYFEAETSTPGAVVEFFDENPGVISYEVVHTDDQIVLIAFSWPEPPAQHRAGLASGTLPSGPLTIQNGWIMSELVTSHDRLSRYTNELDEAGVTYEVVSISQSLDPVELLTDRQSRLVTEAVDRGYYDSPRGCTLTDLAVTFGVNKSTASGILHRAEGQIIKEIVGTSSS